MSTKFYGKSQEVAERIVEQFKTGDIPQAVSQVFVNRSDHIPSSAWSWSNQFICAIFGTSDARGFRQWEKAGRKVSKGSKAFHILAPCIGKRSEQDEKTGENKDVKFVYGFKSIPVFALDSTEIVDPEKWEKAGGVDMAEENRLKGLPFYDVADHWGLKVTSFNGQGGRFLGRYTHGQSIAVGVENLSTWAHELMHAADDKNGTITKQMGQNPGNEIVAEMGGAVLLKIMGYDVESDIGGAWEYINGYSKNGDAVKHCIKLLNRISKCVDLVINTASEIQNMRKAA